MPDPARLTDQQGYTAARKRYYKAYCPDLLTRLSAAENVVEAAREYRRYSTWHEYGDTGGAAFSEFQAALAAYDALKMEPTGNHAESSATRGDTHE